MPTKGPGYHRLERFNNMPYIHVEVLGPELEVVRIDMDSLRIEMPIKSYAAMLDSLPRPYQLVSRWCCRQPGWEEEADA